MPPSIYVFTVNQLLDLLPLIFFSAIAAFYIVVVIKECRDMLKKKKHPAATTPYTDTDVNVDK